MGKGDMKSKRGKIHRGSYGKSRPRKDEKYVALTEALETKKKVAAKPKEKAAPVAEAVAEEPKAKKAPAKTAKPKKDAPDQANLFEGNETPKADNE